MWLKGVAKRDSLLILNKLKNGNNRRFRLQFERDGNETDGFASRKQCTELLGRYFPICDYDVQPSNKNNAEVTNINQVLFDKLKFRKAYAVDVPKEDLKEILMLCLTDTTFPSFVAEVDAMLKDVSSN